MISSLKSSIRRTTTTTTIIIIITKTTTMNLSKVHALIAVALIATSCSNSEDIVTEQNPSVSVFATVSNASASDTRASDAVYAPNAGKLYLSYSTVGNAKTTMFACSNGKWASAAPLYWNDLAAVNGVYPFFAVAPVVPSASPVVSANQGGDSAYVQSDQLVAFVSVPKRLTALPLTFKHVLSQLKVTLVAAVAAGSPDYLNPASATLSIGGVRKAYTLSYAGATSAVPAIATVATESKPKTAITALVPNRKAGSFYAISPAQTFAAGALTLSFIVDGKPYNWSNSEAITSKAGMNTEITLQVKKSSITLAANGIALTDWAVDVDPTDDNIEIEK